MTFTKLDMNDNSQVEGRACVVIYNIGGKELKSIQGYASLLGVRVLGTSPSTDNKSPLSSPRSLLPKSLIDSKSNNEFALLLIFISYGIKCSIDFATDNSLSPSLTEYHQPPINTP